MGSNVQNGSYSIFIKRQKTGRSCILHEKHEQMVLEYIDENPSVDLEQVMERLLQKFQNLKATKSTVYNFIRECNLSLKQA
jgi:transposase